MSTAEHGTVGRLRVALVAGARPNFMKVAPIHRAMQADPAFDPVLVHTGQHYDESMSRVFLEQLDLPEPEVNLGVGSGSHATQTAAVMTAFERVLAEISPDLVIVVGDVNSTLAAAIVAQREGIVLAHVEAGLRSGDRKMPEEINRVLTDQLADWLYTPSADADENLAAEGIPAERIQLVGNVMIDSLVRSLEAAKRDDALERLGLADGEYALVTLHRPSNVDDVEGFRAILAELAAVSTQLPVVFPVHPRTRGAVDAAGELLDAHPGLRMLDPQPYLSFLRLTAGARLVVTDSGGIQEETTFLGIPCLTLRDSTERPVTVRLGTNRIVGSDPAALREALAVALDESDREATIPPLWDGEAAARIVAHLRAVHGR